MVYNAPMLKQSEPKEEPSSPKSTLRLHYFHIRGVAQPVRHLLYHLEVPFEDVLHELSKENEMEVGFNVGFPMLEDGEVRVHEATAIMVYLCRKFEQCSLLGLTPQSIARVQEVMMKYSLQRKRIMALIFQTLGTLESMGESQPRQPYVEAQIRKMVTECRFLEFCLLNLARGKEYVLEHLTIADFVFYEQCFYICGFFQQYIPPTSCYAFFPLFIKRFEKLPFFDPHRHHIEQRSLFHQFNRSQKNALIRSSWRGPKCGDILKKSPVEE